MSKYDIEYFTLHYSSRCKETSKELYIFRKRESVTNKRHTLFRADALRKRVHRKRLKRSKQHGPTHPRGTVVEIACNSSMCRCTLHDPRL